MLLIRYTTAVNVKQHVSGNKQNPHSEQIISIFNWISHASEVIATKEGDCANRDHHAAYCYR